MKIRRERRRYPIIPISAMSDIAFLLLIFIMLASLINYHKEIKIDYAVAENQTKTDENKNFEIWVDKNGIFFYEGNQIKIEDLKNLLESSFYSSKGQKIRYHIIADKDVKYKYINALIELFQEIQIDNVSLVVKEKE